MNAQEHWEWWIYENLGYIAQNRVMQRAAPSLSATALIGLSGPLLSKRRRLFGLIEVSAPRPAGLAQLVDVLWDLKSASHSLLLCESCAAGDQQRVRCDNLVTREDLGCALDSHFGRGDYALVYSGRETRQGEVTIDEPATALREASIIAQDVDGDIVQLILIDAALMETVVKVLESHARRTGQRE